LRSFIKAVDKFSLTHRRFGIPRLMLYIIIGNVAVYLMSALDPTRTFAGLIGFDPAAVLHGQVWRLVTWVFSSSVAGYLSISSLFFTALLLYFYYFIGQTLEREWGTPKFTIYYIFGVVLNIIYGFAVWFISGVAVTLVADYLNLSLLFAFAALYPNQTFLLFFVLPIKAKWLAIIDAGYYIIVMFINLAVDISYAFLDPRIRYGRQAK
jgi:membrane associated rhomboid family serine protease